MTADHTWLLARERGESIDHVPAAQRATYDQLASLLAALPVYQPRPGWQRRLLDALDRADALARAHSPGWRDRLRGLLQRRWLPALAATAAAGGLAIALLAPSAPPPAPGPLVRLEPRISTAIRPGPLAHRARASAVDRLAVLGDTVIVDALLPPDTTGELRAYDDTGAPLGRCGPGQPCAASHDGQLHLHLEVTPRAIGDVRALLFEPGMPAMDSLDRDLTAAQSAHISARQVAIFRIQ